MSIKFIHQRLREIASRSILPHGGLTIAYEKVDDFTVRYAIAKCSEKDTFCKKTGRIKAAGRLKSTRLSSFLYSPSPFKNNKEVVSLINAMI